MEIDACLKKLGFASPVDAVGAPGLTVQVRAVADIAGSPFDPDATIELQLERSAFAPR